MARIAAMALYGMRALLRNKSVVFWSVAWPVLWVLLFAYVFMPPASGAIGVHVALLDNDAGPPPAGQYGHLNVTPANFTKVLLNALATANTSGKTRYYVRVFKDACVSNLSACTRMARRLLIYRGFDAAIIIPENASRLYTLWVPVRIEVVIKGGMPTEEYMRYGAIMSVLSELNVNASLQRAGEAVRIFEAYMPAGAGGNLSKYLRYVFYGVAFPTYPNVSVVKPKSIADRAGMLGWMTLGAIGMSLMTSMLTSGAGFLVFRKSEGVLRRLLASPASVYEFLGEDLIETLLMTVLIIAVTVAVGVGVGARLAFNPLNPANYLALAMIFLAGIFAYGLGFLLAPVNRSTKSTGAATAIGLMLTFTTGIWWPPKSMLPLPLREFASVFPPSCAFQAVRDILVWGKPVAYTMNNVLIAVAGTAALYALVGALFASGRLRKVAERFV